MDGQAKGDGLMLGRTGRWATSLSNSAGLSKIIGGSTLACVSISLSLCLSDVSLSLSVHVQHSLSLFLSLFFSGAVKGGGGSQIVIANPLKCVVAMEIVAADVVVGAGGGYASERHRGQLSREFDHLLTVRVRGIQ